MNTIGRRTGIIIPKERIYSSSDDEENGNHNGQTKYRPESIRGFVEACTQPNKENRTDEDINRNERHKTKQDIQSTLTKQASMGMGHNVQHSPQENVSKSIFPIRSTQGVRHSPTINEQQANNLNHKTPKSNKKTNETQTSSKKKTAKVGKNRQVAGQQSIASSDPDKNEQQEFKKNNNSAATLPIASALPLQITSSLGAGFGRAGREARKAYLQSQSASGEIGSNLPNNLVLSHDMTFDRQKEYAEMDKAMNYMMSNNTDEYKRPDPIATGIMNKTKVNNATTTARDNKILRNAVMPPRQTTAQRPPHFAPSPRPATSMEIADRSPSPVLKRVASQSRPNVTRTPPLKERESSVPTQQHSPNIGTAIHSSGRSLERGADTLTEPKPFMKDSTGPEHHSSSPEPRNQQSPEHQRDSMATQSNQAFEEPDQYYDIQEEGLRNDPIEEANDQEEEVIVVKPTESRSKNSKTSSKPVVVRTTLN
jgi:hypothetical protein